MDRLNSLIPPSLPPGFPTLPDLPFTNDFPPPTYNGGYQTYPTSHDVAQAASQPAVPPMAIPEIRSEADLALFNQFMVSLGRDAANNQHALPNLAMADAQSYGSQGSDSSRSSPPLSDQSPIEDLFNPEELASLGLSGMPGIPRPDIGPTQQLHNLHATAQPSFGLYPALNDMHANRARGFNEIEDTSKRNIAGLPRTGSQSAPVQKPTYLSNMYGLGSTQYSQLPNYVSNGDLGHIALGLSDHHYASFDSLARSKNYVPPATLAPRDFYKKTYRHVAPLGASVSSRSRESAERTDMDDEESMDDDSEETTPKISVRSLLLTDDQADPGLKLPAIHSETEEEGRRTVLPSVTDLRPSSSSGSPRPSSPLRQLPVKRHTEDDLLRGVKRLELSEEPRPREGRAREAGRDTRRRHAVMIRAWLLAVNLEWQRRRAEDRVRETQPVEGEEVGEVREDAGPWKAKESADIQPIAT